MFQETSMAKLDQKFSKGSKSKNKFDLEDDFRDFNQQPKKKKRRIARQREEYSEYDDSNFWLLLSSVDIYQYKSVQDERSFSW